MEGDSLPSKSPGDVQDSESEGSEDGGEWRDGPPVAELPRKLLKDPRTKHQYNPFCRLFFL